MVGQRILLLVTVQARRPMRPLEEAHIVLAEMSMAEQPSGRQTNQHIALPAALNPLPVGAVVAMGQREIRPADYGSVMRSW